MRNLNGFMKYLSFKGVQLQVTDDEIALTETSKEPNEEMVQTIRENKDAINDYLLLDVDRTKPCLSGVSNCIHSMPSIGCINSKHKDLTDRYREDCKQCESFIEK